MEKSVDAFRTISEVADDLALPQHVLRFWETRFPQIRPLKRAGGRRYYRPTDIILLKTIRQLLYEEGFTIKGVQKLLKEQGTRAVRAGSVQMPVDLGGMDMQELEPSVIPVDAPSPSEAADPTAARQTLLPGPIPDRPDTTPPGLAATGLSRHDLGAVREALATIDECQRILNALHRPRD